MEVVKVTREQMVELLTELTSGFSKKAMESCEYVVYYKEGKKIKAICDDATVESNDTSIQPG